MYSYYWSYRHSPSRKLRVGQSLLPEGISTETRRTPTTENKGPGNSILPQGYSLQKSITSITKSTVYPGGSILIPATQWKKQNTLMASATETTGPFSTPEPKKYWANTTTVNAPEVGLLFITTPAKSKPKANTSEARKTATGNTTYPTANLSTHSPTIWVWSLHETEFPSQKKVAKQLTYLNKGATLPTNHPKYLRVGLSPISFIPKSVTEALEVQFRNNSITLPSLTRAGVAAVSLHLKHQNIHISLRRTA